MTATSSQDIQNKVERLVRIYDTGQTVKDCEAVAAKLSELAGLNNGHVWSWNYVLSVRHGKIEPGKKFVRAVDLCLEKINPRQKKWFYFARRRSVAAVYDKCVLCEILLSNFKQIGYKPVTHKRYMQIKKLGLQKR